MSAPAARRREGRLIGAAAFVLYSLVALALDFRYHLYPPDAISRMANGFYVLYSRHPHLAAIGFVWNPLQSLCDMVPLLLWKIWPAVATHDVAGSLVSVLCMTGAVHQLRAALRESGLSRGPRLLLTVMFAVNPMIVYYAANGMSEALYLFTALAACRYLLRWFVQRDSRSLVWAAAALGLCYLARSEAVGIALISGLLVLFASSMSAEGTARDRGLLALVDLSIFLSPFLLAFTGWAVASKVITGQPFQQFTSEYGNTSELALFGPQYGTHGNHQVARLVHELTDVTYMAPLLPLALLIGLIVALRRRDARTLVPLAVLGGGLAFTMFGYLANQVFPWYRFYILAIPLLILLVSSILTPSDTVSGFVASPSGAGRSRGAALEASTPARKRTRAWLGVLAILLVVGPSIPSNAVGMLKPKIGIEESFQLGFLVHAKGAETAQERNSAVPMLPYIEHLHLPSGSVITDEDLHGCATTMIIRSTNPTVFVIPNDPDFQRILADPFTFHVPYILVPKPVGFDVVNAVVKAYPRLYDHGAGFARLVRSFPPSVGLCPPYRLYRVFAHTTNP